MSVAIFGLPSTNLVELVISPGETDRKKDMQADTETETDICMDTQRGREGGGAEDRQTDRDRETERGKKRDKRRDRKSETETEIWKIHIKRQINTQTERHKLRNRIPTHEGLLSS